LEHSNCGSNCSFVKSGFCNSDKECPFYIESWWQEAGSATPKMIKDCYPKRASIEQNNLLHRNIALQGVVEEVRNRISRLEMMLELLISQSKEFLLDKNAQQVDSGFKQLPKTESPQQLINLPKKEGNE